VKFFSSIVCRGVCILVLFLSSAACTTLQDAHDRFPRAHIIDSRSLVGDWHFERSRLVLNVGGDFVAHGTLGEYFDCADTHSNGIRNKSGRGFGIAGKVWVRVRYSLILVTAATRRFR